MSQGSISMPQPQTAKSPLEGILHALQAVHAVYGINTEAAQQKLLASKQAQEELKLQSEKDANDPKHPESKLRQAGTTAGINQLVKSGDMSKADAEKLNSLVAGDEAAGIPGQSAASLDKFSEISPIYKLAIGKEAARAQAVRGQSYGDRNTINVNNDYETKLKPYRELQEDVSRIEGALKTKDKNGNPIITPQQLADANLASARIFSPKHMSDTTMSATEYTSAGGKLAAALQTLASSPQDTGARQLVEHMIDQAHHIVNVSNENGLKELESLDSGLAALSPQLQKAGANKSAYWKARLSKQYKTVGEDVQPHDPDAAYEAYLKAHGGN